MNAGMFGQDQSPVGLYVEDKRKLHEADTRGGETNFHMKPNGVFWIGDKVAGVTETSRYLASPPPARYATQSGPMLIIDGKVHPKIRPDGTSQKIRNGVGACKGGAVELRHRRRTRDLRHVRATVSRRPGLSERALPRWLGVVALCAGTQSRRRTGAARADCRRRAAAARRRSRSGACLASSARPSRKSPRICLAFTTRSTPIAIAAVRLETPSRLALATTIPTSGRARVPAGPSPPRATRNIAADPAPTRNS